MSVDEIEPAEKKTVEAAGERRDNGRCKILREHMKTRDPLPVRRNCPQMKTQIGNRRGEGRRVLGTFMDYISTNALRICISFATSYTTIPSPMAVGFNHNPLSFPCMLLRSCPVHPQVIFKTKFIGVFTGG